MTDGIEKIVSPLRKAMSELDYGIPEYVFDSEEDGQMLADLITKVWKEIDNLEYGDMIMDSLKEQRHSPKIIESILAERNN
jgi:hypothetical protein|tara:strand:+ start:463 stop:705 length:243 start_codon:yes stop_codon:yes gene_type:complete